MAGQWRVEITPDVARWIKALDVRERARVAAAFDELRERGPALGRPYVDSVKRSRYHNMKELRPFGTSIRVLFAFDRRRVAVALVAGDKTNNWKGWYRRNIPAADHSYGQHLRSIGEEARCRTSDGRRSAGR